MKVVWLAIAVVIAVCLLMIKRTGDSDGGRKDSGTLLITYARPGGTQTTTFDLVAEIEKAMAGHDEVEWRAVFEKQLPALIDLDTAAAAALLAKIEPGPFRDEYLLRLAQFWAARDAKAPVEWASTLEDQGERMSTLQNVCLEMAQTDPEGAIRTMESLELTDYQSSLENMVQLWADKEISAAGAWALARPEGEQRDNLLARVAYVMAEQSPIEAAKLVVNSIAPGEVQMEATISIVHRWAAQDWNSARAWVDIFPEGPLRERARTELAGVKTYVEAQGQARASE
jgi:hypothetical protein